jgi:hypothetical protein
MGMNTISDMISKKINTDYLFVEMIIPDHDCHHAFLITCNKNVSQYSLSTFKRLINSDLSNDCNLLS